MVIIFTNNCNETEPTAERKKTKCKKTKKNENTENN